MFKREGGSKDASESKVSSAPRGKNDLWASHCYGRLHRARGGTQPTLVYPNVGSTGILSVPVSNAWEKSALVYSVQANIEEAGHLSNPMCACQTSSTSPEGSSVSIPSSLWRRNMNLRYSCTSAKTSIEVRPTWRSRRQFCQNHSW